LPRLEIITNLYPRLDKERTFLGQIGG